VQSKKRSYSFKEGEQYVGVAATSSTAERIVDEVILSDEGILCVSVIDWSGNILAVKSRESFAERFGVSRLVGTRYSGSLAIATLSLVNEVKDVFGEAQAITILHKDCKLMLLPIPSYQMLVELVLERSPDKEEEAQVYDTVNRIQRLAENPFFWSDITSRPEGPVWEQTF
jgi:hypothetical protein